MVREQEDPRATRCAICWEVLRPKSPLLHGIKCVRFEIKEKLKALLPPQDFKLLFNETVFSNPRICNMCFVTVKKIPRTISKLQNLVGKKINMKLYKPHRTEWNDITADSSNGQFERLAGNQTVERPALKLTPASRKGNQMSLKQAVGGKTKSPEPLSEITGESDNDDLSLPGQDHQLMSSSSPDVLQPSESVSTRHDTPENKKSVRRLKRKKSTVTGHMMSGTSVQEVSSAAEGQRTSVKTRSSKTSTSKAGGERWSLRSQVRTSAVSLKLGKRGRKWKQSQKENRNSESQEEFRRVVPPRNKQKRAWTTEEGSLDSDSFSDIPVSDEDEEYCPPSKTRKTERVKVKTMSLGQQYEDVSSTRASASRKIRSSGKKLGDADSQRRKKNESKSETVKVSKLKPKSATKCQTNVRVTEENPDSSSGTSQAGGMFKVQDGIPETLSDQSKTKLENLAKEVLQYCNTKKTWERTMIKCCINNCSHTYPLWYHMAVHIKYYHHDGAPTDADDFTQKMIMLADYGKPDPEIYQFQCKHKGCDMSFTSQERLDDHLLAHRSNIRLMCSFPDCSKAFRLPRALQVHCRSHTGERPFWCSQPGCGKSFKDSKDLAKHSSRHSGEKSHQCEFEDCGKTFFTISELNSHKSTHVKSESWCCDICGRQYCSEKGLARHRRRMHGIGKPGSHKCDFPGCDQSFVKKEKLEIHLCSHSSERWLFCEKCGKRFSCQRYLEVHYKIHAKNEQHAANPPARTIPCEIPNCEKMFTTRENMKSHVLNQHRGRKPRAMPGVFYPCTVEGCGKEFSFRSTLYRHNKLVHKGGDYKLGREVVKYACTYTGCEKEFNRKNLLEEHMVMEHGKTPKRLLPLQSKDLDYTERICVHCGMVLTVTQLPRHQQVYHSDGASADVKKEVSSYPCHLKNCDEVFNTLEDRKAHVQLHIDSPPFKCGVGQCESTFFLEKNLDNHLWNHSKKACTCPVEGCGRQFDDQLQLAKHSKIHYGDKMKCPWPNCDNWLTETGHLKPHFIAHSRSLMANVDWDFVCEICELTFNSKWGLMIHKRMHGEQAAAKATRSRRAKFTCEEPGCQATLADQKGFFDHFLYHYTCSPVSCDFTGCTENFTNMITMSRHSKLHYDGKFRCPWQGCTKVFASVFIVKKHLYRHILSMPAVAANRPFSCKQCLMVFRYQNNYNSHLEHHNEKSDYICPTCGKNGRHHHMKVTKLSHKTRKYQECGQCGARYATASGLKFHLLQKHKIGKWPFSCSYCGKGFVSSREMQRHIPSHTKEKPFTCSVCQASFASHTGHRAHMRKHTGQKFVCEVEGCGKIYTTPISLRGHKAQHEGFSKTCHYCFKTYKNPYGHKCKASRDSKRKGNKPGQGQTVRPVVSVPTQPVAPIAPPPAAPASALISTLPPSTSSTIQHAIPPQQVINHNMDIQQATRTLVGTGNPLPHPHMMQPALPQTVQPGLGQGVNNQTLPAGVTHQSLQSTPMDMTRVTAGTSVDVTGDYTFNNYIVFWDNHNMG